MVKISYTKEFMMVKKKATKKAAKKPAVQVTLPPDMLAYDLVKQSIDQGMDRLLSDKSAELANRINKHLDIIQDRKLQEEGRLTRPNLWVTPQGFYLVLWLVRMKDRLLAQKIVLDIFQNGPTPVETRTSQYIELLKYSNSETDMEERARGVIASSGLTFSDGPEVKILSLDN